jgi:SAM-dependent methyltransferase
LPEPIDGEAYAARLVKLQSAHWKRFVPNPYRRYLRRQQLGRVLEVGCGVGRILGYLTPNAVGVDTNPSAVAHCRSLGLQAYSPDELQALAPNPFDSLVLAHVLEHLPQDQAIELVASYLRYLTPEGRIVLICPQERGYRSDPTHVEWHDLDALRSLCRQLNLKPIEARSFPLPRWAGHLFVYNEFVVVASISGAATT